MSELRYQRVNGHRVAYRMEGQGQDILFIHGIGATSSTWSEAMQYLATRYRVLAPDLLGHGESDTPHGDYSLGTHASFLRDLLGVLEIRRATLVGHSLGGGIAMQLSYQHPERCERLVLVSSGGFGRDVNAALRLLSLPGAELVVPLIAPAFVRTIGRAMGAWMRRRGVRSPRIHEGWEAFMSLADRDTRRALLRELRSVVDRRGQVANASDRLHLSTAQPTLLVWGDRDSIIPVGHAHAAHAAIPGSRLELFTGAGHFPHAEDPGRFAKIVIDFIESTPPASNRASADGALPLRLGGMQREVVTEP